MEKEIKFRGLRTNGKGWVVGFYCNIENKEHYILEPCALGLAWTEVIPETVGQFTGLKDKNGNEIYEGDVLKISGYKMTVKFSKGCFYAVNEKGNTYVTFYDSIVELIGNIHE